jgi:hypothetical protein
LPPIGDQNQKCWGSNFAWALQYSITASDVKVNNRKDPVSAAISAQYFIDCGTADYKPFSCDNQIYMSKVEINILLKN